MEIQDYIKKKKEIYNVIINIIDSHSDFEDLEKLNNYFTQQNKEDLQIFLHLILEISKYHHSNSDFINKIEKIIQSFETKIKQTFSNSQIFKLFKNSKRMLLLLFKNKIIIPDNAITVLILRQSKLKEKNFHHFFYPEIKNFLSVKWQKKIENELTKYDKNFFDTFEQRRQKGENDNYICTLIRNDSVEEFISYVNQTNFSLSNTITPSLFETNAFLLKKKETTLIEYAAFFGSIQIFQYLRINNVILTPSLWIYAIHSKSAELIHLLEEFHVEPDDKCYDTCVNEAIKCHHNEIKQYIEDNFINENKTQFYQIDVSESIFHFYNFAFLPDDIKTADHFLYLCKYNYITLAKLILQRLNSYQIYNEISFADSFLIKNILKEAAYRNNYVIIHLLLLNSRIRIESYIFRNSEKLRKITIPSYVTEIGSYAFDGCKMLKKVVLPESLKSIGYYSFYNCKELTKISIPSSVTNIDTSAFENCSSLKSISIPLSVKTLENKVFSNCSSLMQITIPNSVTSIGNSCFMGCSSLKELIVPSSVNSIGEYAFSGCSSLTEITIPSSVTTIEKGLFEKCSSLEEVIIPSSVTKIGDYAFDQCKSLSSISIPFNLKSIKKYIFNGCSSLTEITIPSSVTEIKQNAFCGCSSLTKISIPNSLTSIGSFAFNGCSSLTDLSIPNLVTYIGESAFKNCSSLVKISIPTSLTSINDSVFEGCILIKQVKIPSSVIKIGSYSFGKCTSLEKVVIPSSVTKIGSYTFSECSALKQMIIPSSVTYIGESAFNGCSSLTQVIIPNSLQFNDIGINPEVKIKRKIVDIK